MPDSKVSALASGAPALDADEIYIARAGGLPRKLTLAEVRTLMTAGMGAYLPGFRRNAIIGGSAATNPWQRGASFVSPATDTYTADRWNFQNTSSALVTVTKSADAPSTALIVGDKLMTHCFLLDVTTADAAIAAGDVASWQQRIEGNVWRWFAQRPCAIQFWHRHTKTGINCVALRNSTSDRSLVLEYTHAVSDVWQRSTLAIPASPSGGTWNYDNGIGLNVDFTLAAGSTFQVAAGAWQVGNFRGSANQVNNLDNAANNFRIEDVRIVLAADVLTLGEIGARSAAEELFLCQRYYQILNNDGLPFIAGYNSAGSYGTPWYVQFPVEMRASPTITHTPGTFSNVTTLTPYVNKRAYVAIPTYTATGAGFFYIGTAVANAEL